MVNPYNKSLIIFFEKINFLFGSFILLDNQLDNYSNLWKKHIKDINLSPEFIVNASCLLMQDIMEKSTNPFPKKYISGMFEIKSAKYFNHLKEIKFREASWCVSQAFEAFIEFIKNIIYTTHKFNPNCITNKQRIKFEKNEHTNSQDKNNYLFNYVKYTYNYNKQLIPFFKNFSKIFKEYYKKNSSSVNYQTWFNLITKVRNATVHNEMIIKPEKLNYNSNNKLIVDKYFPVNLLEKGYLLQLTSNNVRINLETFSEFGFLIYKSLSTELNYDLYNLIEPKPFIHKKSEKQVKKSVKNKKIKH